MFGSLSERLNHIFSKITQRGKLTELEINNAMREIRVALLEADVNFAVAKKFVADVSEKAKGAKILESLTPGQQVVKLVNEELIAMLGNTQSKLDLTGTPPSVIMMCGLQGAGKTTFCGKLASYLKSQGKRPLLVGCDIYRNAAIDQLRVVGKQANVEVFERGKQDPVKTSIEAIEHAKRQNLDVVIIDTAGRLHIDEDMMQELQRIKDRVKPNEILFTIDAMIGQDAVTVAKEFDAQLNITGIIVTKLDGDTRGGVTLSVKAVTGKPIKFCGIGEKLGDIEAFHPERMASRILGMGDVLTLIEKAQSAVDEKEMQRLQKSMLENSFTLEDFLAQYDNLDKMGDINQLIEMIPGAKKKLGNVSINPKEMARNKAIIQSMTIEERRNPELIKASQKKRIAYGSGTNIQDINNLLKQFAQSKDMMRQFTAKGKQKKGRFPMF
ncbi:MAG: signal recognition particle protein [Clostridia bacterium]|nr:signal recognition particle protein [Clostridia bacterium]